MLYCWLQPEAEDKVPRFATHQVGCAGWVTNARGELLVVREWRDADAAAVALAVPLLKAVVNHVERAGGAAERAARTRFALRRHAQMVPEIWLEFLFGALLSSEGADDVRRLNAFLPRARADAALARCALTMLRANRVGVLARCAGDAVALRAKV